MVDLKKLKITIGEKPLVDISLTISNITALVGASGSGKTLSLKALLGLLPSIMKYEIDTDFELIRGETIAFIPQNPFTALSPLTKIKKQLHEEADQMVEVLQKVSLDSWVLDRFPNELSGGQLQRVLIALAILHKPKLLLLDEPTTALDKASKDSVLALIKEIAKSEDIDMLFVTHDMATVSEVASQIYVIDEGKIIESGKTDEILNAPKHPQTKDLISSNFLFREFRS